MDDTRVAPYIITTSGESEPNLFRNAITVTGDQLANPTISYPKYDFSKMADAMNTFTMAATNVGEALRNQFGPEPATEADRLRRDVDAYIRRWML